ncbi:hypothetical protein [uncultured Rubinisphaera sp.]|mgnify:CR=1 FL=1|uniref:hypothetical protein n=1 Tax=uncultured Rubinisphaera sp. TaxID=1678686 RepID=UPI0030DCD18B
MRAMTLAYILIFMSTAYFALRAVTTIGGVPPLPVAAAFLGVAGVCILIGDAYARVARRMNKPPKPPYYMIDATHGRCLELDADGSYTSCQTLLTELANTYGAQYSNHLDPGPTPGSGKDKGYWNLKLFGQDFFLMRQGGYGICIWGPSAPADLSGFLRLADHFDAIEFINWPRRLFKSSRNRDRDTEPVAAK